jgi:hypothetical protein
MINITEEGVSEPKCKKTCTCKYMCIIVYMFIVVIIGTTVGVLKTQTKSSDEDTINIQESVTHFVPGTIEKVRETILAKQFATSLYPPAPATSGNQEQYSQCFDQGITPRLSYIKEPTSVLSIIYDAKQPYPYPNTCEDPTKWPNVPGEITVVPYEYAIMDRVREHEEQYVTFTDKQCMKYQDWILNARRKYQGTLHDQTSNIPPAWQSALNADQWAMYIRDGKVLDGGQIWTSSYSGLMESPSRYLMSGIFEEVIYTQVFAKQAIYTTVVVRINVPLEDFAQSDGNPMCVLDTRRSQVFDPVQLARVSRGNLMKATFVGTNPAYRNDVEANDIVNPEMVDKAIKSITTLSTSAVCEAKFGTILSARSALIIRALDSEKTNFMITEQFILTTFSVAASSNSYDTYTKIRVVCELVFGIDEKSARNSVTQRSSIHDSVQRRFCVNEYGNAHHTWNTITAYAWTVFPLSLYQSLVYTSDYPLILSDHQK